MNKRKPGRAGIRDRANFDGFPRVVEKHAKKQTNGAGRLFHATAIRRRASPLIPPLKAHRPPRWRPRLEPEFASVELNATERLSHPTKRIQSESAPNPTLPKRTRGFFHPKQRSKPKTGPKAVAPRARTPAWSAFFAIHPSRR